MIPETPVAPAAAVAWAALVWGYALAWFLVNDRIKLAVHRILDPAQHVLARRRQKVCQPRRQLVLCICTLLNAAMPRPRKHRRCRAYDGDRVFKPRSIPMRELETTRLELSELEAMRLCDLEGLDQQAAGETMGVSRGTIQRLLKSGRAKVLGALLQSRALLVEEGGNHEALYTERG